MLAHTHKYVYSLVYEKNIKIEEVENPRQVKIQKKCQQSYFISGNIRYIKQ